MARPLNKNDLCSAEGAAKLREMVRSYWARRGVDVTVTIVTGGYDSHRNYPIYGIRSDMIGGQPAELTGA